MTKSNIGLGFGANGISIGYKNTVANVTLDISTANDAVALPVGNTAQEPKAKDGYIRYNYDSARFEGGIQNTWTRIGGDLTVQNNSIFVNTTSKINFSNGANVQLRVTDDYANGRINVFIDSVTSNGGGGNGSGVTSISTGIGLTGGPITSTGTISANIASISVQGITKLIDTTSSTDSANAATANSVNSVYKQASNAYIQANSARSDLNATAATINTTFGTVNTNITNVNSNAAAAYIQANAARSDLNTTAATINTTFSTVNTNITNVNSNAIAAYLQANNARSDLNTTAATINTTFATLNTNITNVNSNATAAYGQANSAYAQANLAYTAANTAQTYANNLSTSVNTTFATINTNITTANTQANLARDTANTKVRTYSQNTPPVSSNTSDLWINVDSGIVYTNANSTWVEFGPFGIPNTSLFSAATLIYPSVNVTSTPYLIVSTDYYVGVNVASAATINLPSGTQGRMLVVKDERGNAQAQTITIVGNGSDKIDGYANVVLAINYGSLTLFFNNGSWRVI